MLEFENIKTFLLKYTLQIGQKKLLLLVKLKIQFFGHVVSDLNGEEIIGIFYEKELQKTSQEKFRIEKVLKRKERVINCTSNGKGMIIVSIVGLIKKDLE